jgi:hypothetical protein
MVGCVLSYHIENIANFTVCCRGDLEIYKQINVLEGGLWSDWGHDRRLCVCGRGGGYFNLFIDMSLCRIIGTGAVMRMEHKVASFTELMYCAPHCGRWR